jgi:hypothetical protein
MSTQELFVQQFTRLFHHYTEALSSDAQPQASPGGLTPSSDSNRLLAAARLAILELETNPHIQESSRRYFAKPGEAEWGC